MVTPASSAACRTVLIEGYGRASREVRVNRADPPELGLSTIWLRHARLWPQVSYNPTSTADTLEEALDMLLEAD